MNLLQRLLNRRNRPAAEPKTQDAAVGEQEEQGTVQYWCDRFNVAKARGDADAMKNALMNAYHTCKSKNSMCLDEMFCPECPMGGLAVPCGRAGL